MPINSPFALKADPAKAFRSLLCFLVGSERFTSDVDKARPAAEPCMPASPNTPMIAPVSSNDIFKALAVGPKNFIASDNCKMSVLAELETAARRLVTRLVSSAAIPNCPITLDAMSAARPRPSCPAVARVSTSGRDESICSVLKPA